MLTTIKFKKSLTMFQTTNISGKQDLIFEQAADHAAKEEENVHCWRDPAEARCPDRARKAGEESSRRSAVQARTACVSPRVLRGATATELGGNVTSS